MHLHARTSCANAWLPTPQTPRWHSKSQQVPSRLAQLPARQENGGHCSLQSCLGEASQSEVTTPFFTSVSAGACTISLLSCLSSATSVAWLLTLSSGRHL